MAGNVKLVVYVPLSHADAVRMALGDAGAGQLGHYSHCSFSARGVGRYKGDDTTRPFIGEAGTFESTEEERIEVTVTKAVLQTVLQAMRAAHPYEEVAFDIYPLLDPAAL